MAGKGELVDRHATCRGAEQREYGSDKLDLARFLGFFDTFQPYFLDRLTFTTESPSRLNRGYPAASSSEFVSATSFEPLDDALWVGEFGRAWLATGNKLAIRLAQSVSRRTSS